MPTFAAIDIGSNSVRLKIATVQQHHLKTVHEDREVVRLGESVFQTGVISPEAMAQHDPRAEALPEGGAAACGGQGARGGDQRHARRAQRGGVYGVGEVGDRMEGGGDLGAGGGPADPPGSGDAGAGRARAMPADRPGRRKLRGDAAEQGRIREIVSLPLGAVRLQQEFLRNDPPEKQDVARLRQFIDRELSKAERKLGSSAGGRWCLRLRARRRRCRRRARRWRSKSRARAAAKTARASKGRG